MDIHKLRFRHALLRAAVTITVAFVVLTPAAAAADSTAPIVFNARKDFRLSPNQANPGGVWSYRETYSDGTRRLLTHHDASLSDVNGIEAWTDDEAYLSWPWVPAVWYNNTGSDVSYLPAKGLFVHPSVDHVIVIRWTSPSAGLIAVRLTLTDRDTGGGNGIGWSLGKLHHVRAAAGTLENGGIADTYIAGISVRAGDRIDLKVNARQEQGWDTTQVGLKIMLWPS